MQTLKLKYQTDTASLELIKEYMRQYSSCLHFYYNRVLEQPELNTFNQLKRLRQNYVLNNVELLDIYLKQCAQSEAIQLVKTGHKKVIFGGKKNFYQRLKGNISNEEWQLKKLSPIYSIGSGCHPCFGGNQKFQIEDSLNSVIFKPKRAKQFHIELELTNKLKGKRLNLLKQLFLRQQERSIAITYKLDLNYVYISFDEKELSTFKEQPKIKNRVLAVDMNPNYVGWSIVDWLSEAEYKVIETGIYNLKLIQDKDYALKKLKLPSTSKERKYISNKRNYETTQIGKNLISKAIHYKVEIVAIEKLTMEANDRKKGKSYNKLTNNQWLRQTLEWALEKRCNIYKIKFIKVLPEYSSQIGNIIFRETGYADPILSSIEIGRRSYEFYGQYKTKERTIKKNIVRPDFDLFNNSIKISLEEMKGEVNKLNSWNDIFKWIKNSKIGYRVPLGREGPESFRFFKTESSLITQAA